MLATLVNPVTQKQPRTASNPRTARRATQRRISRKDRARYVGLFRFCAVLTIALCMVMIYVTLTARLTSLNYAVGRAQRERAALLADAARLEDRISVLRSDDRLATVAGRLHMQDPQEFAVVTLPPAARPPERPHLAFLADLASIFGAK